MINNDHLSPTNIECRRDWTSRTKFFFHILQIITIILIVIYIFAFNSIAILQNKIRIMIAGHMTTALIAKQKFPKGALLYFLIISQLQDLLWFTFHYLGFEPTEPIDAFDATLSNMVVDMLYSHDLLPQLFWLAIVFLLGKLLFKSTKIGLVSVALSINPFYFGFLFRTYAPRFWSQIQWKQVLGYMHQNLI